MAVFKDNMFWDDWKQNSFYVADKDHGIGIETIGTKLFGLMDLKVNIEKRFYECAMYFYKHKTTKSSVTFNPAYFLVSCNMLVFNILNFVIGVCL